MYPALHDDLSVTNTLQKLSIREQSLWLSVTAFLYAFCIAKRNFFTALTFYYLQGCCQIIGTFRYDICTTESLQLALILGVSRFRVLDGQLRT